MHFYGDYNLSGMEFVKITEFYIRHLETIDDDLKSEITNQKAFYPFKRFNNA